MNTEKEWVINKLKWADTDKKDWWYDAITYTTDLFASGYLSSEIRSFTSYNGSDNKALKAHLLMICEYDIWGK